MAVAGAALPTALLHKGLQVIFSLAAVFCFGFQAEYPPPPEYFFNVKTQFCWQFLSLKNQCYFTTFFAIAQGQYRIILSADTASEVRQLLSQKRR